MNCKQVNEISIINYLKSLGFEPHRVSGSDYFYHSPFRDENKPSFKVNSDKNIYYDHGEGSGGRLVDFICRYNDCDIKRALEIANDNTFSFHQQKKEKSLNVKKQERRTEILSTSPISNSYLIKYLKMRFISSDLFGYLKEVKYKNSAGIFTTIGFCNDSDGYELRTENFQGCTSKDITTIKNNENKDLMIFEGFMDFLSYLTIKKITIPDKNVIVLNSLSNIQKLSNWLNTYERIYAFLDNDNPGKVRLVELQKQHKQVFDMSMHYSGSKDLNDYLTGKILNK